ncbi:hypothetical protein [Trueperella pecoris]|uniref:Uncharacterized protein n=1 Tax=Trueperella pecoris TaxID=2733571 RepID=A0A7M1QTR6_9ACTO|nr:hypothetical protein [Trueperella pecoris]QOR45450.1 hypothetical protein INS88_09355 [Trueperella pecoris]
MYTSENIASQYGMRKARGMYPAEIGAEAKLTFEQVDQMVALQQAYYQDLRNSLVTECAEYVADELEDAGYTAEQVRETIEDARRAEYGTPDTYSEIERITRAGIISAVEDTHQQAALMEAFGIPMEFGEESIPGDIVLGHPVVEPTTREAIKDWNCAVVLGDGANLRWAIILQVAAQVNYRHGEWILEATTDRM